MNVATKQYRIEYYWAAGCNGPDEDRHHPHGEVAESIEHAINMIWPQVRENWRYEKDAFLAASFEGDNGRCYHEYPEDHERGYGCGGFCVIEE